MERSSIHVSSQARVRPFSAISGSGVFHSLSTSGRPSVQAKAVRSQGRDRLVDSFVARRAAARRGPSDPTPCGTSPAPRPPGVDAWRPRSRHRNEPGRRPEARDGFSTGTRIQLVHSYLLGSSLIHEAYEGRRRDQFLRSRLSRMVRSAERPCTLRWDTRSGHLHDTAHHSRMRVVRRMRPCIPPKVGGLVVTPRSQASRGGVPTAVIIE